MQSNQNLFVGMMNKIVNENGSFQFQYERGHFTMQMQRSYTKVILKARAV